MSMSIALVRCRFVLPAGVALLSLCSSALAAGPFAGFAGNWKGGGTIQTEAGQEAITCKARYTTVRNDSTLSINMICASDSYRVNIVSNVVAQGSNLSGSWQETTRQLSGDVSGRIPQPNTFQANLQTTGGGLQIGASTNGRRQMIAITSQGTEIRGANIMLKKR